MKPSFADAHVHLFNMADLPAGNFVKYVAIPQRFPNAPAWAAAIVDLVATLLKGLTPTAADELDEMGQSLVPSGISPSAFGEAVASHMRGRMNSAALTDPQLVESYRELNRAIAADFAGPMALRSPPEEPDARRIAEVARKADGGPVQPGDVARQKTSAGVAGAGLGDAVHLLGWAYIMMLTRRDHERRYRRRFHKRGTPKLVLNHLVDYDLWLDETPSAGSDQLAQVAVMDRIRAAVAPDLDLRLYAGFCPLKFAIESRSQQETTFDKLLRLVDEGKVHGFKLYPPMGFQATGNAKLADADFDPPDPGRRTALDRWNEAGAPVPLGEALDDALERFYATCTERKTPMMAHAARSNAAGPGYADRADPAHWAEVTRRHNLRLTLGHLVDHVGPFVRAVEAGPPYPSEIWSLATGISLLDPKRPGAAVYGDIGYTQEILDDAKLSLRFFTALKVAFGERDPELSRILYGTDWIMLGLERHSERYLDAVLRGMRDADYSDLQQRNILENNLRRAAGA